jgi:hypothetical protein
LLSEETALVYFLLERSETMAARIINATNQRIHSPNFRFRGAQRWTGALAFIFCIFSSQALIAQTAGSGGIQGTVTNQSGAVVPNVTVTATRVETSRPTSGDGLFNIAPLIFWAKRDTQRRVPAPNASICQQTGGS